jgi:hypothetical protein
MNTEQYYLSSDQDTYFKCVIASMTKHANKNFAIIADTVKKKNELRENFLTLFDSVPTWLLPEVEYRNKSCLILQTGFSVFFINSAIQLKGRTLSGVFISEGVVDKKEFLDNLLHLTSNTIVNETNAKQTD